MGMRLVMIGDVVGRAGRRVVQQQLAGVRERYAPDLVIANGENAAGGSGLTPKLLDKLKRYGVDGVTLGDHALRRHDILPALRERGDVVRPANLPASAPGARSMTLATGDGRRLHVIVVLGRLFMSGPLADDPFATVEALLEELESGEAPVLVEIHAETTSEKMAVGHCFDGRVAAVVGTHTHVPTADAKVLPGGTAYITDLGMCGPYDSVLGRKKSAVLQYMTTAVPAPFDVAEGDPRLCGVFIELDDAGRAVRCERLEAEADLTRPPFTQDEA